MATATQNAMSMEIFHASSEYKMLTDSQQSFVDAYVESHDAPHSLEVAYGKDSTPQYRSMLLSKVLRSAKVLATLDLYFGRTPREKFIRDLSNNIAKEKGIARVESLKLYARVTGLIDGAPSDTEHPVCKIGDIVLVDGVKHRVTAIDPSGRPTDGEPL